MNLPGSRLALGGAGLTAACAVVCCSAPLLVVTFPGLALIIGWATEAIETGLIAALVLGALVGAGVLIWRHQRRACSKGTGCGRGCRCGGAWSSDSHPGLPMVDVPTTPAPREL